MAHCHKTDACCQSNLTATQTLEEVLFERGLWKAAIDGNVERVKALFKKSHDPNAVDSAGYTALHYSARHGHFEVCELLLKHGADVNPITPAMKSTPLHRAAIKGHEKTVKTLLDHGAEANLRDADGKTALHRTISTHLSSAEAVKNTSLSNTCKLLLPHTDLDIKDSSGRTIRELITMEIIDNTLEKLDLEMKELDDDLFLKKMYEEGKKNKVKSEMSGQSGISGQSETSEQSEMSEQSELSDQSEKKKKKKKKNEEIETLVKDKIEN